MKEKILEISSPNIWQYYDIKFIYLFSSPTSSSLSDSPSSFMRDSITAHLQHNNKHIRGGHNKVKHYFLTVRPFVHKTI